MLSILASGALVRDPHRRQTAAGKEYATCLLRCAIEDGDPVLVSIIAFDADVVAALLALQKGDSCAIAGRAKLTEWTGKDGGEKRGLNVTADRVLTAYQAGKQRKASREAEDPEPRAPEPAAPKQGNHGGFADMKDDVPF